MASNDQPLHLWQDKELAQACPALTAILGGHDHDPFFLVHHGVLIAKCGQNAAPGLRKSTSHKAVVQLVPEAGGVVFCSGWFFGGNLFRSMFRNLEIQIPVGMPKWS